MAAVEVYKDKSYSGISAQLGYGRVGDVALETGVPNDSISSIRIGPFTKATFYKDRYFAGPNIVIRGPAAVPDLSSYTGGLNNEISSILVERVEPTEADIMMCCTGQSTANCGEYAYGTPLCKSRIAKHCSTNLNDPFCKAWCKQNPELCDNVVIDYCRRNPTDPYCSCINSKASGIANPKCVDRNCITNGYLTTSMISTPCPAQVDCRMYVALSNSGVNIASQVPIQQNCGDVYDGPRSATPIVSQPSSISPVTIIIIVVVFILLVLLAIIIASASKSKPQTKYY